MDTFLQMSGKHILITGGSSGIGRQTAIQLSQMGAKLELVSSSEEKLKETLNLLSGDGHGITVADLSQIEAIEERILLIVKERGPMDGYVHCAGIVKNLPVSNYNYQRLHSIMLVNFYSYFEIIRVLSKKGRFNPGMSIVGVSSVAATNGAIAQAAYCASKAAMNGAMRGLAIELGAKGIRLNNVLPAATDTNMYNSYLNLKKDMKDDAIQRGATARQYLGMNTPSDVANAIIFLLSPASEKITGIQMPVDGGYASC